MKLAWSFNPGPAADHLSLDVFCELTQRDERILRPAGKLSVSLLNVPLEFPLLDARLEKCVDKTMQLKTEIVVGKKWQLKDHFPWLTLDPKYVRLAVVMAERIKTEIVAAMIVAAPMASFQGVVKTYDVDVETPKELTNMEHWKRSVLIRGS